MKTLKEFESFLSQLKTCIVDFDYFCDFDKVRKNVKSIEIKLNILNYLLGKEDLQQAIKELWKENSSAFDILEILIAVRAKDKKSIAGKDSKPVRISEYLKSPELVYEFIDKTGLKDVFMHKDVKNLVDYVFGVEVGMDTNARKNRGGKIMEFNVAQILRNEGVIFQEQYPSNKMPLVQNVLGKDIKKFDFVIKTKVKTYLMEVNFYSDEGSGSKLNEVSRSFDGTASRINALDDYEFVWVTDGRSWINARNKLEEAFNNIPRLYNLTTIMDFIKDVKSEGQE